MSHHKNALQSTTPRARLFPEHIFTRRVRTFENLLSRRVFFVKEAGKKATTAQLSLTEALEESITRRAEWLLTGCYKVLRSMPRRNFFYRLTDGDQEQEEFNSTLSRWAEWTTTEEDG